MSKTDESIKLTFTRVKRLVDANRFKSAFNIFLDFEYYLESRGEWQALKEFLELFPAKMLAPQQITNLGIALMETGQGELGFNILQQLKASSLPMTFFGIALHNLRQSNYESARKAIKSGLIIATKDYEKLKLLRLKLSVVNSNILEVEKIVKKLPKNPALQNDFSI